MKIQKYLVVGLALVMVLTLVGDSDSAASQQHSSLIGPTSKARQFQENSIAPRKVSARFLKSPFADYLVYLLYRGNGRGRFKGVEQAVPLSDIPTLDELVSLPGVAASAQIQSYFELQSLLLPYRYANDRIFETKEGGVNRYSILGYSAALPSFDKLSRIIALGEPSYSKFAAFWERTIAPEEDKKIAEWREQMASGQPFDKGAGTPSS